MAYLHDIMILILCSRFTTLPDSFSRYLSLSHTHTHPSRLGRIYIIAFQSPLAIYRFSPHIPSSWLRGRKIIISDDYLWHSALHPVAQNLPLYDDMAGRYLDEYSVVTISVRLCNGLPIIVSMLTIDSPETI